MITDPIKRALELRKTLAKDDKILVVDYSGTLQGKDTSRVIDLMPDVSNNRYVFRTKVNVKEMDPLAAKEYKKDFFDIKSKSDDEIENFVKKQEFDFPLWYKHNKGFKMKNIMDYNPPFVSQVGGCNFHDGSAKGGCWYCFVDDKSNDGKPCEGKSYLGAEETVESMLAARKRINSIYKEFGIDLNIKVLRSSGGEPTIVLDKILDFWRTVEKKGADFVGQIDSNLSTGYVVEEFEKQGIFEENILDKLADYPIKVLTAIKGVSDENLKGNVQSKTTLEEQRYSIRRFLEAGFDIYPQMYNPDPERLREYLENMDGIIENFSSKIHIGPLKIYGPTTKRLTLEAERTGANPEEFIKQKKAEWDHNLKAGEEIMDAYLRERYGVEYKEVPRPDVKLKLL